MGDQINWDWIDSANYYATEMHKKYRRKFRLLDKGFHDEVIFISREIDSHIDIRYIPFDKKFISNWLKSHQTQILRRRLILRNV